MIACVPRPPLPSARQGIEKVKVTKADKPIMDIKIISVMCTNE